MRKDMEIIEEAVSEEEEVINDTVYVPVYNWIDDEYHLIPEDEVESYYRDRM